MTPDGRGKPKIRQTNYWRPYLVNGWTPERRQRQAAAIQQWRPWERSTGPKSETGKAKVARNAFKGGWRPQLRELARALREQREVLTRIR